MSVSEAVPGVPEPEDDFFARVEAVQIGGQHFATALEMLTGTYEKAGLAAQDITYVMALAVGAATGRECPGDGDFEVRMLFFNGIARIGRDAMRARDGAA